MIFIYALGQYVYYDKSSQIIQMARTKSKVILTVELIISIFNVIGILFLSYHIYFEIRNLNDTECPYPNEQLCHASISSNCPLSKQTCAGKDDSYQLENCYEDNIQEDFNYKSDEPPEADADGEVNFRLSSTGGNLTSKCNTDLSKLLLNNFIFVTGKKKEQVESSPPDGPSPSPSGTSNKLCKDEGYESDSDCADDNNALLIKLNESAGPCTGECTQEQCCKPIDMSSNINKDDPRYNWIAKEKKLEEVEEEVEQILEKIGNLGTGPPGPPGPPGTPGSDGLVSPTLNLQSNIVCSKDGVCPAGKTKCNDKGQCVENFALISLEEKINLQNKYKDLNHNSYKANKLMNNLEQYLLNTFK